MVLSARHALGDVQGPALSACCPLVDARTRRPFGPADALELSQEEIPRSIGRIVAEAALWTCALLNLDVRLRSAMLSSPPGQGRRVAIGIS